MGGHRVLADATGSPPRPSTAFAGEGARALGFRRSYKNRLRAIGPPSRSCGDAGLRARGLQRIALQSRRIVLQRADAVRFGLAAPLLQVAQGIAGVAEEGLEQRRQARAVFAQGADRSEKSRVVKECGRMCKDRWSHAHK